MLIRNIKSSQDLEAKKALAKQLLDVEVANELENERRVLDFKNPYKPKEIPPQFKSNSELQKDRLGQEKEAMDNLEQLGLDYQQSSKVTSWLSSSLINRLVEFNANFKGIKKDITETTNPKLLSPEYLENYLERYFEDLDVNYGRKMDRREGAENVALASSLEELKALFPNKNDVKIFENKINKIIDIVRDELASDIVRKTNYNEYDKLLKNSLIASQMLNIYEASIPDDDLLNEMRIALTQNERQKLIKSYSNLLRRKNVLSPNELNEMNNDIDRIRQVNELNVFMLKVIKSLSQITDEASVDTLTRIVRDFQKQQDKTENADKTNHLTQKYVKELEANKKSFKALLPAIQKQSELTQEQLDNEWLDTQRGLSLYGETGYEEYMRNRRPVVNVNGEIIMAKEDANAEIELEKAKMYQNNRSLNYEIELINNNTKRFIQELENAVGGQGRNIEANLGRVLIEHFGLSPQAVDAMDRKQREESIYKLQKERVLGEYNANPNIGETKYSNLDTRYGIDDPRRFKYNPITNPSYRFETSGYKKQTPEQKERQRQHDELIKNQYESIPALKAEIENLRTKPRTQTKINKIQSNINRIEKEYSQLQNRPQPVKTKVGLGLKQSKESLNEKIEKHFHKDEKEMKKLKKAYKHHVQVEKEVDSSSDSDREVGVGFRATRIKTKKIGKGVSLDKAENPTYRSFGKYVVHIPHLLNNNMANFKYPSLGSIPAIKPMAVSEDYKEFLVDILNKGNMDEKVLKHLPQNEIKHFEKVCIGAGLVEKFKLKISSADEDKKDLARFELLKGEYNAGNNSDKLLKELRMLIVKFMNNGRIHKSEGMNLLMELATV